MGINDCAAERFNGIIITGMYCGNYDCGGVRVIKLGFDKDCDWDHIEYLYGQHFPYKV